MDGPVFVVSLVLGILLVQVAIWIPILLWMRSRTTRASQEFRDDAAASGERVARGPESASYIGGSGAFGGASGLGVIALTDRRLWFRKLTGGVVELPAATLQGVREEKWFRRRRRAGQMALVVRTRDGSEVGFYVNDRPAWLAALQAAGASGSAHG